MASEGKVPNVDVPHDFVPGTGYVPRETKPEGVVVHFGRPGLKEELEREAAEVAPPPAPETPEPVVAEVAPAPAESEV